VERFTEDLQGHVGANRIAHEMEGADLSRVSGTPTFFINGRRHHGAYDIDHLSRAVRAAGARAKLVAS
jgi:protein-disulfide isomerase